MRNLKKDSQNGGNIKVVGTTMFRLTKNLNAVKKNLKMWNKNVFKNVYYRKAKMKERLNKKF